MSRNKVLSTDSVQVRTKSYLYYAFESEQSLLYIEWMILNKIVPAQCGRARTKHFLHRVYKSEQNSLYTWEHNTKNVLITLQGMIQKKFFSSYREPVRTHLSLYIVYWVESQEKYSLYYTYSAVSVQILFHLSRMDQKTIFPTNSVRFRTKSFPTNSVRVRTHYS